jgi:glycosyltransferase involved in cell wall biosynthesis
MIEPINHPVVSVVLPVYNAQPYLKESIESILNQTFTNFEFIIINDGSTDNSLSIIQTYADIDNRIILISRENKGLVASLNEGIQIAKTELIARMDADDIALPTRLEKQLQYLNDNEGVICLGSQTIIIDSNSLELTIQAQPTEHDEILKILLKGHCSLTHPSVIYKKERFNKVGGYNIELYPAEDYDLWLRLSEVGTIANLGEPFIKYRILNTSVSATNLLAQQKCVKKALMNACKRRNIPYIEPDLKNWRETQSSDSMYDFSLQYGWWAFNHKNKQAAISYAQKAIKLKPFRKSSWMLIYCSLFRL